MAEGHRCRGGSRPLRRTPAGGRGFSTLPGSIVLWSFHCTAGRRAGTWRIRPQMQTRACCGEAGTGRKVLAERVAVRTAEDFGVRGVVKAAEVGTAGGTGSGWRADRTRRTGRRRRGNGPRLGHASPARVSVAWVTSGAPSCLAGPRPGCLRPQTLPREVHLRRSAHVTETRPCWARRLSRPELQARNKADLLPAQLGQGGLLWG